MLHLFLSGGKMPLSHPSDIRRRTSGREYAKELVNVVDDAKQNDGINEASL